MKKKFKEIKNVLEIHPLIVDKKGTTVEKFPWIKHDWPLTADNMELFHKNHPDVQLCFNGVKVYSPSDIGKIRYRLERSAKMDESIDSMEDIEEAIDLEDFLAKE